MEIIRAGISHIRDIARLEKEIFSVINQSLKAALDAALKDILKDFK